MAAAPSTTQKLRRPFLVFLSLGNSTPRSKAATCTWNSHATAQIKLTKYYKVKVNIKQFQRCSYSSISVGLRYWLLVSGHLQTAKWICTTNIRVKFARKSLMRESKCIRSANCSRDETEEIRPNFLSPYKMIANRHLCSKRNNSDWGNRTCVLQAPILADLVQIRSVCQRAFI